MFTRRMTCYAAAALSATAILAFTGRADAAGVVRPYAEDAPPGMALPGAGVGKAPAVLPAPLAPVRSEPASGPQPATPRPAAVSPAAEPATPVAPASSGSAISVAPPAPVIPVNAEVTVKPLAPPAAPAMPPMVTAQPPAPVSPLPPTANETGANGPRQQPPAAGAGEPSRRAERPAKPTASAGRLAKPSASKRVADAKPVAQAEQRRAAAPAGRIIGPAPARSVPSYCRRYACSLRADGSLAFAEESRDPMLPGAVRAAGVPSVQASAPASPEVQPPVAHDKSASIVDGHRSADGAVSATDLADLVETGIAAHRADRNAQDTATRGPRNVLPGDAATTRVAATAAASPPQQAAPSGSARSPADQAPADQVTAFIPFAVNSAAPAPTKIAEILAIIGDHPGSSLLISGYGAVGRLAQNRAVAVRDSLIEKGVSRNRLVLTGTGTDAEGVVVQLDLRRPPSPGLPSPTSKAKPGGNRRTA